MCIDKMKSAYLSQSQQLKVVFFKLLDSKSGRNNPTQVWIPLQMSCACMYVCIQTNLLFHRRALWKWPLASISCLCICSWDLVREGSQEMALGLCWAKLCWQQPHSLNSLLLKRKGSLASPAQLAWFLWGVLFLCCNSDAIMTLTFEAFVGNNCQNLMSACCF